MRRVALLLTSVAVLQAALLVGQLTTLVSTHWTSWNLRINWTQTLGPDVISRRPPADGQLVSQGHAGLWSRCVKLNGSGRDFNDSRLKADKCLSNFDDLEVFTYGKICKLATGGLCVSELVVTLLLLCVQLALLCCRKTPTILIYISALLLIIQGLISVLIPVLYIAGNMAELVDQLTNAYDLLLVVYMEAWYVHDWAYWLQVSLSLTWAVSAGLQSLVMFRRSQESTRPADEKNGRRKTEAHEPELESLRVEN